ncbi:hypothetical protein CDD83_5606 [Cordyceps sp. RAO-2017]|nr:hypothetical protein CDD83_5606 [Cordyceps sp. RAO-2017]
MCGAPMWMDGWVDEAEEGVVRAMSFLSAACRPPRLFSKEQESDRKSGIRYARPRPLLSADYLKAQYGDPSAVLEILGLHTSEHMRLRGQYAISHSCFLHYPALLYPTLPCPALPYMDISSSQRLTACMGRPSPCRLSRVAPLSSLCPLCSLALCLLLPLPSSLLLRLVSVVAHLSFLIPSFCPPLPPMPSLSILFSLPVL